MAGRGRSRLPEIRRGQGERRTGPDRPDLRSRRLRRGISAEGRGARRKHRQLWLCRRNLRPPGTIGNQPRWPVAQPRPHPDAAAIAIPNLSGTRQPAGYGAPSNGPISLTAPGVAPQEDDDRSAAGRPRDARVRRRRYGLPSARSLIRAAQPAPYSQRPRSVSRCRGSGRAQGNAVSAVRSGRDEAGGDAGLPDRLGARSLARRFGAAGGDALVRRRASPRSSRSPPIPAAA